MSNATNREHSVPLDLDAISYHREGFLVLRNVFEPAEMDALAADAARVLDQLQDKLDVNNMRVRFTPHHQTGEPIFEKLDPIADLSPVAASIAADQRILDVLQRIYKEPACLFKDKLIYKPPGATGATLHQDWISWPGFPQTFLTVLVAIDPFTAESGATQVYPREHLRGYLSPQDGQHHHLTRDTFCVDPVALLLNPGDIAIFSCFLPHFSDPNDSVQQRRGYFISYNALSDGGEQYQTHYPEYHAWLRTRMPKVQSQQLYFA